jgi:hypothetical protein
VKACVAANVSHILWGKLAAFLFTPQSEIADFIYRCIKSRVDYSPVTTRFFYMQILEKALTEFEAIWLL